MARETKIQWCDHTLNLWEGCAKVSAGCKNCYAETRDNRFHCGTHWGVSAPRRTVKKAFTELRKWQRAAAKDGVIRRVFCSSLADVFERQSEASASYAQAEPDKYALIETHRQRLWAEIEKCPNLIFMLLTKRPENVASMVPAAWMQGGWPENVWLGVSVEDQAAANERIPHLLETPAAVRFLSCEPLLGPVDLENVQVFKDKTSTNVLAGCFYDEGDSIYKEYEDWVGNAKIQWVIVGGESGPNARPMHPDWARSLRDQAVGAGEAFFFKHWGIWIHDDNFPWGCNDLNQHIDEGKCVGLWNGADKYDYAYKSGGNTFFLKKVNKESAGRLLDGREWNEYPDQKGDSK